MSNTEDNNQGQSKLRDQLQYDLTSLEQETNNPDLFSLAQARKAALAQSPRSSKRYLWPALGASLASVMLVVVLVNPIDQGQSTPDLANAKIAGEILSDGSSFTLSEDPLRQAESLDKGLYDSVDIYEDLDFYDWLAQAET